MGKASGYKEGGFPVVLDDFMGRLIHMCYGATWATKFGGASAMVLLGGKLPVGQLMTRSPLSSSRSGFFPSSSAVAVCYCCL